MRQLGNAVPVDLAAVIARSVAARLTAKTASAAVALDSIDTLGVAMKRRNN
jgi:hypothetical protein